MMSSFPENKPDLELNSCLICTCLESPSSTSSLTLPCIPGSCGDPTLQQHLWTTFVLRNILNLPQEEIISLLRDGVWSDDIQEWSFICSNCLRQVHQGYETYLEIIQLQKTMERLKEDLKRKLQYSFWREETEPQARHQQHPTCQMIRNILTKYNVVTHSQENYYIENSMVSEDVVIKPEAEVDLDPILIFKAEKADYPADFFEDFDNLSNNFKRSSTSHPLINGYTRSCRPEDHEKEFSVPVKSKMNASLKSSRRHQRRSKNSRISREKVVRNKKESNKKASFRYREKNRQEWLATEELVKELEVVHNGLIEERESLYQEILVVRGLLETQLKKKRTRNISKISNSSTKINFNV